MAVDLFDYVDALKTEVQAPGEDAFPDATDTMFADYLVSAFWNIRMLGMFSNYSESDYEISPITGTTELPRELVQLILVYAAINIVTNQLKAIDTVFRAKAGPVEFETQKSAQLLRGILEELQRRRAVVEGELLRLGYVTDVYIDAAAQRDYSLGYGQTYWMR